MASSFFYVGEIGLNDYNFALNSTSIEVAVSLVPDIIGAIRSALTVRIGSESTSLTIFQHCYD